MAILASWSIHFDQEFRLGIRPGLSSIPNYYFLFGFCFYIAEPFQFTLDEPQFIWAFWASWAFHGPGLLCGLEAHFLDPSTKIFLFFFFFSVFQNIPDLGPPSMGLSFLGLLPAIAGLLASNGHMTGCWGSL